jgi:hypothetical protein
MKKWAVCPTCRGNGAFVNPAIDENGITEEDLDQFDEDFLENYMSGMYDVKCSECEGYRVVPACKQDGCHDPAEAKEAGFANDRRSRVTGAHFEWCFDHMPVVDQDEMRETWEDLAQEAAERRMGA